MVVCWGEANFSSYQIERKAEHGRSRTLISHPTPLGMAKGWGSSHDPATTDHKHHGINAVLSDQTAQPAQH